MKQASTDLEKVGKESSTSDKHDLRSASAWLASANAEKEAEFLNSLNDNALAALPWIFEFWALPHQLPPDGDWTTWVVMGGRGAGKTRAGAEWVRSMVEGDLPESPGRARRVALVGETYDQALAVMVKGESGIIACSPPDRVPRWVASERMLIWPNGAEARLYSANDPEALRGPQFDLAWVDELAKWPNAQETWDMLQFGLRLGEHPQQIVTTTPRNVDVLKALLARDDVAHTHAPTEANSAYLASSFLKEVRARYGETKLGRQELDGMLVDDVDGALWTRDMLAEGRLPRADKPEDRVPYCVRVIVAVDPPVTSKKSSDACGIVVVAIQENGPPTDWHAVVVDDCSVQGKSPREWAQAAVAAYHRYGASRLVAEVNQGGEMVKDTIRTVDPTINFRARTASHNKVVRAEPVASLYEQKRVRHAGVFAELEDEMCKMAVTGFDGSGSPDRVDALVWALTEGLLEPARNALRPGIRGL